MREGEVEREKELSEPNVIELVVRACVCVLAPNDDNAVIIMKMFINA